MNDADFRSLIQGERQRLINYVRSRLTETADMDAEDVVHDVLVKMLERPDSIAPLENLAAYVYRSLRNRVIDHLRARRPTLSLDEDVQGEGEGLIDILADIAPDAFDLMQSREGQQALFEALETLPDIERQVVIAHELEGTPFKTLAEAWGVPQNTLLSHKSRAIRKLKQHFLQSRGDKS